MVLLVMLVACGGKSSDDKPATGSGSGSAPAPGAKSTGGELRVSVAGKPVAVTHAFIKRVSPDHYRMEAGPKGSCEELLSGVSGAELIATIRKLVAPDGTEASFVTDFYVQGKQVASANGTPVVVAGTADKGSKAELDFLEIVDAASKLDVAGKIAADGCGDQPSDVQPPKLPDPSTAKVTLADKKTLELRSASLHGDDLALSTGPLDCSPGTPFAQIVLERTKGTWKLSGTWIGGHDDQGDMKGLTVKLGAPGTAPGGAYNQVTLSGSGKIGGYAIAISGVIDALDCE
jgi:hypothetical protein